MRGCLLGACSVLIMSMGAMEKPMQTIFCTDAIQASSTEKSLKTAICIDATAVSPNTTIKFYHKHKTLVIFPGTERTVSNDSYRPVILPGAYPHVILSDKGQSAILFDAYKRTILSGTYKPTSLSGDYQLAILFNTCKLVIFSHADQPVILRDAYQLATLSIEWYDAESHEFNCDWWQLILHADRGHAYLISIKSLLQLAQDTLDDCFRREEVTPKMLYNPVTSPLLKVESDVVYEPHIAAARFQRLINKQCETMEDTEEPPTYMRSLTINPISDTASITLHDK